jgi:chemotaxis protein methyltransferase CheR
MSQWPIMPPCDIVFLRNVLLYFNDKTRQDVLERTRKAMRPDAALFLGGAETMLGIHANYERQNGVGCSYYQPC